MMLLGASAYGLATNTLTVLISMVTVVNAACSSNYLGNPSLPDGQITSLQVTEVTNYTARSGIPGSSSSPINFCNVSITYTHPGKNDSLHVQVWLPLNDWNGRLQGVGGGGWDGIQSFDNLAPAVAANYSAVGSDLGHALGVDPASWALDSSGNVNIHLLEDFASVGLNDASVLAKQVVQSFYGKDPAHSYWNGCSTGGRQGMMLAQRYPTAYNGIMAGAPAFNWPKFIVAEYWPQLVMNEAKIYPSACVFQAIQNATIAACDKLDGAVDGIISSPSSCNVDYSSLVGKSVDCGNSTTTITAADTSIAQKVIQGARTPTGDFLWYGLEPGTPFSALAGTNCSSVTDCQSGVPFSISTDWIKDFIMRNASFDDTTITFDSFVTVFKESVKTYSSIIATDDPNLSAFKKAGGKLVHWHGLTDQLIFPRGSENYYQRATAQDSSLKDFYRYFPAPGVEHCSGGNGPAPSNPLDAVVQWVEHGIAPDVLAAKSRDGKISRNLCPYPQVANYIGGDINSASSFECA